MNQAEYIESLASTTGFTKADTKRFVEAQAEMIQKTLKKTKETDDGVSVPGLGKFKVRKRSARMGRNPQTGEDIKIPAKKVPVFAPTKSLKDLFVKKK